MPLQELESGLKLASAGAVRLGRLYALSVLGEARLNAKRDIASTAVQWLDAAFEVNRFLARYCLAKPGAIVWGDSLHPLARGLLRGGAIDARALTAEIFGVSSGLKIVTEKMLAWIETRALLAAAAPILGRIVRLLPDCDGFETGLLEEQPAAGLPNQKPFKAVAGPLHVAMDPSFEPTFSLLQSPVPGFGQTVRENVPYFWGLAIRESLAADLCALSIFEYDGLPLDFYCDMAKQAWDEMRHSTFFFGLAVTLMPQLQDALPAGDPLHGNIRRFLDSGNGLPIPKERNLYEAIANASLVERLILLHRDTETPGIIRIKEKIASPFCRDHPEIAKGLAVILRDEVTHARFGSTWLEYLVPDEKARNEAIETTELLRGVFLLASFAHHGPAGLRELMNHYSGGASAPVSPVQALP